MVQMVGLGLAVVVLLVVIWIVVRLFGGARRSSGSSVLFVGPCDAGKTTLLLQLRDGTTHQGTVASMVMNEANVKVRGDMPNARPIRIVDIPGHPRLRNRLLDEQASSARGVVFLVDSVDFMPKKSEVAEQLYEILTHPVIAGRRLPILLAGNKSDLGSKAHRIDFVRKMLEREIESMRSTKGSLAGDQEARSDILGVPGEAFSFENLSRAKGPHVTFASVSAIEKDGAGEIEAFLRRCVPA